MKLCKSIVLQKLGNEYIVYDSSTSMMHELNESAYFILSCIKKGIPKEKISQKLADRYAITPEKAGNDVDEAVRKFTVKEIIEG